MKQKIPQAWKALAKTRRFFDSLAAAPASVLMLDYDGTLAPFTQHRLEARPYAGVQERLEALIHIQPGGVVMISGRRANELHSLLDLRCPIEIWGSHGREHRGANGNSTVEPLTRYEQAALREIRGALEAAFDSEMLEGKLNSVAVHWRGVEQKEHAVRSQVEAVYARVAIGAPSEGTLKLLHFDGGLEIRAGEIDKGIAVQKILAGLAENASAAFLGDDVTDEDAFAVLQGAEHLSVLVGRAPRLSFAEAWLQPPEDLLAFLDLWIAARARFLDKQPQPLQPQPRREKQTQ